MVAQLLKGILYKKIKFYKLNLYSDLLLKFNIYPCSTFNFYKKIIGKVYFRS